MATSAEDAVDDAVEDPSKVLVIQGVNSQSFHKFHREDGDLVPDCPQARRCDPDDWRVWDREMAEAWKEPCQNADCYGDRPYTGANTATGDD